MELKEIKLTLSQDELHVVTKIGIRAQQVAKELGINYELADALVDITACHLNGCALDLDQLLHADNFYFNRDVFGIAKNISLYTGKLRGGFMPCCARKATR